MKSDFILVSSVQLRLNSFNKLTSLKFKWLKKGHAMRKDIIKVKAQLRCSHVKETEKLSWAQSLEESIVHFM